MFNYTVMRKIKGVKMQLIRRKRGAFAAKWVRSGCSLMGLVHLICFMAHWSELIWLIGRTADEIFTTSRLLSFSFLCLGSCHKLGNMIDSEIFKGIRNVLLWLCAVSAASSLNKTGPASCDEYCIKVTIRQIPLFSFYSIATLLLLEIVVVFLVLCQAATSRADWSAT